MRKGVGTRRTKETVVFVGDGATFVLIFYGRITFVCTVLVSQYFVLGTVARRTKFTL
jgi:hypothetical protein